MNVIYRRMAIIEVAVFIFLLQGISCKVVFPKDGFRFNCGSDICTFPLQYCDIADSVCKYCSQDVCNSGDVPHQCYTACSETTVAPVEDKEVSNIPTSLSLESIQTVEELRTIKRQLDKQWVVLCVCVGITGLVLIIDLAICLLYIKHSQCHKKILKKLDKPLETLTMQQKAEDHKNLDKTNTRYAGSSSSEKRSESEIQNAEIEETIPLVDSSDTEKMPDPQPQQNDDPLGASGIPPPSNGVIGSPQCHATEKDENFGEYRLLEDGTKADFCGYSRSRKLERSISRESKSENNLKHPVMEEHGSQIKKAEMMVVNEVHNSNQTSINKMLSGTNVSEDSGHFSHEDTPEKRLV